MSYVAENLFDHIYHQNGDVSPVEGKRRRKPPGDWWRVDNVPAGIVSPHQQLNPKKTILGRERKPQSRQNSHECWSLESGEAAVSPRPVGGAAVSPLSQCSPKSVKQKTVPTDESRCPPPDIKGKVCFLYRSRLFNVLSSRRVTDLRSGPTSLIALEQHEDSRTFFLNWLFNVTVLNFNVRFNLLRKLMSRSSLQ